MESKELSSLVGILEVDKISLIWPKYWDDDSKETSAKKNIFNLSNEFVTVDDLISKSEESIDDLYKLIHNEKRKSDNINENKSKRKIQRIMCDVVGKVVCNGKKCNSSPAYNFNGRPEHLYCSNCALPGMINIARKKCQHGRKKGVRSSSACPYIATHGDEIAMFCEKHIKPNMRKIINLNPK